MIVDKTPSIALELEMSGRDLKMIEEVMVASRGNMQYQMSASRVNIQYQMSEENQCNLNRAQFFKMLRLAKPQRGKQAW